MSPFDAASALAGKATLAPLSFADLAGWDGDDHAAAFATFRKSCAALARKTAPLRPALAPGLDLTRACRAALAETSQGSDAARLFFERHFRPMRVLPRDGAGFLTGYYEPEFQGSRVADATYRVPLLDRPDDLVTVPQGGRLPGLDPTFQAGRRQGGGFVPYPDRAAIEEGALSARARPVVFLREPGEAFIIHVQGSARIRLTDGTVMRVAYAGRNGHSYTSIGKLLVQRGVMDLETMTLARLMGWLAEHPAEARDLMRQNRSYIFFREAEGLALAEGPIGGAGLALTPGRSLAVDRTIWPYGLPIWLDGTLPHTLERTEPLRRLMVAQDTGSAIVGPVRGDYFVGSGKEAGDQAGLMRHPVGFVILQPRPAP
ncbi:murein transglycosylase A [Microvirga antarctica]|uniref:murein transglycosylase A n=1 Tax=Microvirga antarctica TaxID=2819233 RepID=UPI001FE96A75|nr:MltA domain-containing protein [Microvirga antarctica]